MSQKPCPNCGVLNAADAHACADCWTEFGTGAAPTGTTSPPAAGSPSPADSAPGYASGRPGAPPPPPAPAPPSAAPGGFPPPPPPPSAPATGQPPVAGRPGSPPFPAQGWTPPQAQSSRKKFIGPAIGIVIGIAVVRAVMGGAFSSHSVTLPANLGGQPRMTSGSGADTVQGLKDQMEAQDIHGGDAAAYGNGATPSVMVFSAPGDPDTLQELYDSATADPDGSGTTFGTPNPRDAGGLPLLCSDFSLDAGLTGSLCVWSNGNEGLVIAFDTGIEQTAVLAGEAKAGIT